MILWDLNKHWALGYQTPSRLRLGFRTASIHATVVHPGSWVSAHALWDAHTLKGSSRLSGLSTNGVIGFFPGFEAGVRGTPRK
jgi:hypothetical protein